MKFLEKTSVRNVRVALGLMVTGFVLSSTAMAQDEIKSEGIQKIVVTGSSLKRIDAEGAAAVIFVNRVDIERSGASSVVELLQTMAGTTSSFDGSNSNSFAQGAAAVSLRGLGEKNVLVLLNGRRLANYGFAQGIDSTFFDLNSLPLSVLERVEVLRDGASAIYGSDAVAGVINFITRKNYQGVEVNSRLAMNQARDGQEGTVGITAGFGNLATDKQNVLFSLDIFKSRPTLDGKHALTKSDDFRRFGGIDGRSISLNPGSFYRFDEAAHREAMPGCLGTIGVDNRGDQYCYTDTAPTRGGVEKNRVSFAALYTRTLNEHMELFAETGFSRNNTKYDRGFLGINAYNHYIYPGDAAYKDTLNGIDNGGRLLAFRSVYEAGRQQSQVDSDSGRMLLGLRGESNGWDFESAFGYSQNKVRTSDKGLLISKIDDAYTNGGYDPFKQQNSAADVAALITPYSANATSKLSSWDAKMSKENLFSLPAGNVGFAAGVSILREKAVNTPDPLTIQNKIEDIGGTGSIGQRTVKSIYAELAVPIIKHLDAQVAVRHDRYSDFGGTTNPKLALTYRAMDSLLFRGSATTSFKAPTLPQLYLDPSKAYPGDGIRDTIRCIPLGYVGSDCAYYPELKVVSNPNLKPEKSKNFSAGMVFEPIKNYSISIDYYKILQRDTIASLDLQYIVDHEFSDPKYAALIERNPRNPALELKYPGLHNGRLFRITDPYDNVGRTETDGVDVILKGVFSVGQFGRINLQDDFNTILSLKQSDVPGSALEERVGGRYNPKWRNTASVAWSNGAWNTQLKFNTNAGFVDSGYVFRADATTGHLPTTTSTDLVIGYTGIKDATINFGIRNLLDRTPRFSVDNGGFMDSTSGRYIFGSVRYAFK